VAYLLQQLVTEAVHRYPDKVAVRARGRSLTYGELERRSSQLARLLHEGGIQRGDRVGLYFPKAVESIVAMLGVLKAGAVYVPLDPHAPAKRVAGIADDCALRGLVTTPDKLRALPAPAEPRACTVLLGGEPEGTGEVRWSSLETFPTTAPAESAIESDLA